MKCDSVSSVPPVLMSFLFAPLIGLTACGPGFAWGRPSPPTTYTLSVSPQPASIPVNGTVTFTATTNGPSNGVVWGIVDVGNGVNEGAPTNQSGLTFTYTAPPTPPIFESGSTPAGSVAVAASNSLSQTTDLIQFNVAITAPSITTGFSSTMDTVALGKTLDIWAYAVGSTNNAITMQVNGSTGGSMTYGTIAHVTGNYFGEYPYGEYTYTAPATMPTTGDTVTVTVISVADPTKSSSMTITLTP